jgi:hypothetical protein
MAIDFGGLLPAVLRFVTEEFRVWRKRHRLGRPIEIHDRLDELVRIGESLRSKWLNKKRPRWRTQRWIVTTRAFVKRHFSISQYDEFNIEAVGSGEEGAEMRVAIILKLQTSDSKGYALAMQVRKNG